MFLLVVVSMVRLVGDVFASCAGSVWVPITIIGLTNRVNSIEFGSVYPGAWVFIRILASGIAYVFTQLVSQLLSGGE